MSFDLYAWKGPIVREGEDAGRLLDRALDDVTVLDPSVDVSNFREDLVERFPDLVVEASDRLVEIEIPFGAPDDQVEFIVDRARRHGLVLYDPQGPDVHLPDDPLYPDGAGEWPPFTRGAAFQAARAGVVGLAIVIVAWVAAIPILTWIAIIIGGFLFVMSILTFIAEGYRRFR